MAHNITKNAVTGRHEVFTRLPAWHKLNSATGKFLTWHEAAESAGLLWTVSKRQLDFNGVPVPAWGVFRDDIIYHDAAKAYICPSTDTYELMQNDFMFAFLDAVVESEGAHYESAGSLNNGAQVWAMVNLNEAFEIGNSGDVYQTYVCFTEDRTGKRAARCWVTMERVVCENTLNMAYNGKSDASVSFRHTSDMHSKMTQALDYFDGRKLTIESFKEKMNRLADRVVTRENLENILDRLFPYETIKQKQSKNREERVKNFLALFEHNDDNMFPEIRGTAYNLLNAVTEYTDHYSKVRRTEDRKGISDDTIRAERALFGEGATYKQGALEIILEETAYAPLRTEGAKIQTKSRTDESVKSFEAATDDASLLDSILTGV